MVSLEAVAMEAAKVAVRELHDSIVARQASIEAQMYGDDAEDEESCVAAAAMVAGGTTVWLSVDGDETEVEDDDEEAKAAAEAQRDTELRATEVRVKAAAEAEAAEQAALGGRDGQGPRLPEGRRAEHRRSAGCRPPRRD
jgi:hypothetical protein